MNDFKPTQVVKIKEGETEKVFPLYDLNELRSFLMHVDNIPDEYRENIKRNSELIKERLEVVPELQERKCAIVGYGPTLKSQWPRLKQFNGDIISTSGAHKFLVNKDIIPSYHVEVDFRERKAVHTNEPHSDITYLLSSSCSTAVVNNVKDKCRVKLWHGKTKGIEFPKEELVLSSYWDAGQSAIMVAKALGYRDLHLFGFDYSFEVDTNETHAGFHNGAPSTRVFAKVGKRIYQSSDSLVRGMLAFDQLMKDNSDLHLTIYSNGLLAAYLQQHYTKEG